MKWTPENFVYWLQGYFEITGQSAVTEEQSALISKNLASVFEQLAKDLPVISEANFSDEQPLPVTDDNVGYIDRIDNSSIANGVVELNKKFYQGPLCTVSC